MRAPISATLCPPPLIASVRAAVGRVHDPEYPGVSIVDLGLLEAIEVSGDAVTVSLVPTYGGCPALDLIADDVRHEVEAVVGVRSCTVTWLRTPVWTQDRVAPHAVSQLEREFTVTLRRTDGSLVCPVCGSGSVRDTAPMGPSRCRSLAYCDSCRNPVEVMR